VLRGLGDEIITKEDCISRSGPMSVGAPGPIDVRVDHELECE
jgi:hypothetical protein